MPKSCRFLRKRRVFSRKICFRDKRILVFTRNRLYCKTYTSN